MKIDSGGPSQADPWYSFVQIYIEVCIGTC